MILFIFMTTFCSSPSLLVMSAISLSFLTCLSLLLEAPAEFVDGARVKGDGSAFSPRTFSLASVVPNSTPPRDNQPKDKARVAACLLSLVLLLGLTSTDVTELLTISIALGFFLVSNAFFAVIYLHARERDQDEANYRQFLLCWFCAAPTTPAAPETPPFRASRRTARACG